MTEFKREFFTSDPVFHRLYMILKGIHVVADHTKDVLVKNRHIENFCEESRYFIMLNGLQTIYIHYDVSSWWKEPTGVLVKVDSICVYDSFVEYETARMRQLHSGKNAHIPNIN